MKNKRYIAGFTACIILGCIFIFAGIGKLLMGIPAQIEFLEHLSPAFRISPNTLSMFVYLVSWVEIISGICLISQVFVQFIVISLCVPLSIGFMLNNVWMLSNNAIYETCNSCFGIFEKFIQLTPLQALFFDIILLGLCCFIIFINVKYPLVYGLFKERE